jgi:predicted phage terminase large subunit-like protein
VHDVVFDRGDKSITMPRVVGKVLQHKIKSGLFEANSGGDFYCDEVNRLLREKHNYSTNIGSKRASSKMSKLSRIEQHAPAIKRFYFRDATCRDTDYKNFMEELTMFSFTSKNLHDDAADALAGLSDKLYYGSTAQVEIGRRLW